jgi:hypothetical protein
MVRRAMHVCVDQPVSTVQTRFATYVHSALDLFVAVNAAVAKVPHSPGIHSAFFLFQLRNELHRAHLGRTTHRSCALSAIVSNTTHLTYQRGRSTGTHRIASCRVEAPQKLRKPDAAHAKTGSISGLTLNSLEHDDVVYLLNYHQLVHTCREWVAHAIYVISG